MVHLQRAADFKGTGERNWWGAVSGRCSLSFCCPTRVKTCGSLGARAEDGRLVDHGSPHQGMEMSRIQQNLDEFWVVSQTKGPGGALAKVVVEREEAASLKHSKNAMQMGFRTRFMGSTLANKSPMAEPNLDPKCFFFHGERGREHPYHKQRTPWNWTIFVGTLYLHHVH